MSEPRQPYDSEPFAPHHSERFRAVAPWLLELEGYWSDDAADRGGATKFGVSLRYLAGVPDRSGDGYRDGDLDQDGDVDADDVRLLRLPHALELYWHDFWLGAGCHLLPPGIDRALFCGAVNHGPNIASRFVQQSLRVTADGKVGPKTAAAAARADARELLADHLSRRAVFYRDIVHGDPTQAKWLRGWFRRLFLVHATALADLETIT